MVSLPQQHLACVLEGPQSPWRLQNVPMERPGHGQILIKVECCGFCYTDLSTQSGHLGSMVSWPTIPGHEVIGHVVAVGDGVDRWEVGDRVGGSWHGGHDNTCRQCQQGFFQGCERQTITGVNKWGGFAEYCILNSEAVARITSDKPAAALAPFLCAGVTMFNSMRHQNIKPGETVAIQGLGGLGHLGIQYANKMGFRVVAISTSEDKRGDTMRLGAHHFINSKTQDVTAELESLGGAKMIVLTAPNKEAMGSYTRGLTWQGKLIILAPVGDVGFDSHQLIAKSCTVGGWHAGHALDCEEAINFAELHDIQSHVEEFSFAEIDKAAQHLLAGKARYRAVLKM